MEGALGERNGKMGDGVIRFGRQEVVCVIDSRHHGKTVGDVLPIKSDIPIVATVARAHALGAQVLLLGIAPSGGRLPLEWEPDLKAALLRGMSLVNGLHDRLEDRFASFITDDNHQRIWDIRKDDTHYGIGTARASRLRNKRVLMIGTDMAVGKMTAGLVLNRWLNDHGRSSSFLATGQVGITITGAGIPLDAIKVDQAAGAVEELVMTADLSDVLIIEGQGSLAHPGSTATLPLMRGSCPTHLILCHRAGMAFNEIATEVAIPPLRDFIRLNQEVASIQGSLPRPEALGIALNTSHLSEEDARVAVRNTEEETGLPVTDFVRFGPEPVGRKLL